MVEYMSKANKNDAARKKTVHMKFDRRGMTSCPFCVQGQVEFRVGAACGYCGAVVDEVFRKDEHSYREAYMSKRRTSKPKTQPKRRTVRDLFPGKADAEKNAKAVSMKAAAIRSIRRDAGRKRGISSSVDCPACGDFLFYTVHSNGNILAECEACSFEVTAERI